MDIDIEDNGDGTFSIYYTVKDAGEHTINIKFGGQPIPDGVYSVTVSALTKISWRFRSVKSRRAFYDTWASNKMPTKKRNSNALFVRRI